MTRLIPLLAFLAVAILPHELAIADDASDRKRLIDEIDDKIEDAADDLKDVHRESSASDVNTAIRTIESVSDLLSKLDRIKGDDSTAKDMVSRYPNYIRSFKESAQYLIKLKEKQTSIAELPKRCTDLDKNLREAIKRYVEKNDPAGLDDLPKTAESAKSQVESWWRDADSRKREMEDWRSRAQRFSESDRKWSDVKSAMQRSASDIYSEWEKDWKKAEQDCKDLKRGDDHPAVEEGLKKLSAFSASRVEITRELERQVKDAANYVKDIARDSDDRDLESALRKADEVSSTLGKLKYAKGTDRGASEIVEKWPSYVSSFKASVSELRKLKKWQYTIDKAPQKCQDLERKLDEIIRKYVDSKDSAGVKDIPLRARGMATDVTESLKKADSHDREMQSWRSAAERISISDNRWSDANSAVRDGARYTYEYWKKALEQAHRACDELAKGDRHSKVERALSDLRSSAGSAVSQAESEARSWISDAKATYRLDCEQMEKLWDAYCGADWEPNEQPDKAAASQVSKDVQSVMKPKIDPLMQRHDEIEKKAKALAAKDETKAVGERLLKDLAVEKARLERIKKNGYRGASHPMIQYAIEYGKQQHKSMESSYSCLAKDQSFPGAGGRPDCVAVCWVYEFKPNNSRAKTKGKSEQLSRYVPAVNAYYQKMIDKGETPPSDMGGSSIIEGIKKSCFSGGKVDFRDDVKTYNMCEKKYVCEP